MKQFVILIASFLLIGFPFVSTADRSQFTPYDDFPGIIKDYKPAYDESFPDWGRMLYEYPVNFNVLTKNYETCYQDRESEKNALTRYYKLWTRSVGPNAQADGSIHMPDLETYQKPPAREHRWPDGW